MPGFFDSNKPKQGSLAHLKSKLLALLEKKIQEVRKNPGLLNCLTDAKNKFQNLLPFKGNKRVMENNMTIKTLELQITRLNMAIVNAKLQRFENAPELDINTITDQLENFNLFFEFSEKIQEFYGELHALIVTLNKNNSAKNNNEFETISREINITVFDALIKLCLPYQKSFHKIIYPTSPETTSTGNDFSETRSDEGDSNSRAI